MNVTLELIDAASGAAVATDVVRLDSLPERFEGVDTHLTLGDTQYRVVGADPSARDDIAKAGRVRLLLAPVPSVDPRAVLFSVPTLEDGAAPIDAVGDASHAIALHEDDWRQIELLSAAPDPWGGGVVGYAREETTHGSARNGAGRYGFFTRVCP